MKDTIKLLSILLLVNGMVFTSCEEKPSNSSVSAPTNLSVTDITGSSARLTWLGTADSYEIMVGSNTYTATTTVCEPTDLAPATQYTWKVRAKKGSNYSNWVTGTNFTTTQLLNDVTVQFGNVTWKATLAGVVNYNNQAFRLVASKTEPLFSYPTIHFTFRYSGTTTFPTNDFIADYFEERSFYFDENPEDICGDWWGVEGSINVTSVNASKVSGNAQLEMVNAYQYFVEGNDEPDVKTLTLTFHNVEPLVLSTIKNLTTRNSFSDIKNLKRGEAKAVKK